MFNETDIVIDGMHIHLLSAGESGSPVVLLHGGGTDSAALSWRECIPALAENHRVFAPDWPGYGLSDRPKIDYTTEFYADFLGKLLDALNLEKASLAGLSLGGASVLLFALQHPERVERLALVDSYGFLGEMPYGRLGYYFVRMPLVNELTWWSVKYSRAMSAWLLKAIFGDPKRITPELVDECFALLRQPNAGRAWMSFQRSEALPDRLRSNFTERLGELTMPVLLIHGEKDNLVPLSLAEEAQRRIPHARLAVIPGAGHWPQRECPREFNRILAEFLEEPIHR